MLSVLGQLASSGGRSGGRAGCGEASQAAWGYQMHGACGLLGFIVPHTGLPCVPHSGLPCVDRPLMGLTLKGLPLKGLPLKGVPLYGLLHKGMPLMGLPLKGLPPRGLSLKRLCVVVVVPGCVVKMGVAGAGWPGSCVGISVLFV